MITYYAVYANPKVPDPIVVHSLNPQPKYRTFKAAGGLRRFKRVNYKQYTRKVIIVAKSAKVKKKSRDLDDEDLEELEALEELDDLDDEDEDDEEPEDEDEDEDDDDEDDDGLDDTSVKDLRARARKDGHEPSDIRGKNKQALIDLIRAGVEDDDEDEDEDEDVEEDDDDLEDDEDEDDDEEDTPPPKRSKSKKSSSKSSSSKTKSKKSSGPSRSRTTDGKVGVQEVAEAAGTDARKLRMVLRKHNIEKDDDVGRYEWSSLSHPEVKKILKLVKGGAVKAATKESLDKLKSTRSTKSSKSKTTDAPRKKSSAKKKKRSA